MNYDGTPVAWGKELGITFDLAEIEQYERAAARERAQARELAEAVWSRLCFARRISRRIVPSDGTVSG